ncbi:hypothetical protein DRP44_02890 [candidate division TA06 bacterium]|uniref:Uncharacterized protein n=1 Tax=candidate division TA06 bacterium TaxID=2250710 RepID=A0A660S9S5_UNCT6|nr:MAG: hypothetical protein DRP44_02890 [candidate division TA06 bacterium]
MIKLTCKKLYDNMKIMVFIKRWKRAIAFYLSVVLFLLPIITYAFDGEMDEKIERFAAEKGREDAIKSIGMTQKVLWFGTGLLFNVLGVGTSVIFVPGPKLTGALGKPSKALKAYVDEYKTIKRNKQLFYTGFGCLVGTSVVLFAYAIYYYISIIKLMLIAFYSILATAGS